MIFAFIFSSSTLLLTLLIVPYSFSSVQYMAISTIGAIILTRLSRTLAIHYMNSLQSILNSTPQNTILITAIASSTAIFLTVYTITFILRRKVNREGLTLKTKPLALFYEKAMLEKYNKEREANCEYFLHYRDDSERILLPIKDINELATLFAGKEPNIEDNIKPEFMGCINSYNDEKDTLLCCKCRDFKPRFTETVTAADGFFRPRWKPLCQDCAGQLLKEAINKEDVPIESEDILSRTL